MATELDEAVKKQFPSCVLKEKHFSQLLYSFPSKGVLLSEIFLFLMASRQKYNIEDYSVSQTTLDEVFVSFAQKDNKKEPKNEV